jgi:hypothetical protein
MPIPVATRSMACVCDSSFADIGGSNPSGGRKFCLVWIVVCCKVEVFAMGQSFFLRSPTEFVCVCVGGWVGGCVGVCGCGWSGAAVTLSTYSIGVERGGGKEIKNCTNFSFKLLQFSYWAILMLKVFASVHVWFCFGTCANIYEEKSENKVPYFIATK